MHTVKGLVTRQTLRLKNCLIILIFSIGESSVCLFLSQWVLCFPALPKHRSLFHWEWIKSPCPLSICWVQQEMLCLPTATTTHAKACFYISEKSQWGHGCRRYRLIQAISPRWHFNFSVPENTAKNRHQIRIFKRETQKTFSYALIFQSPSERWVGLAGLEVHCIK